MSIIKKDVSYSPLSLNSNLTYSSDWKENNQTDTINVQSSEEMISVCEEVDLAEYVSSYSGSETISPIEEINFFDLLTSNNKIDVTELTNDVVLQTELNALMQVEQNLKEQLSEKQDELTELNNQMMELGQNPQNYYDQYNPNSYGLPVQTVQQMQQKTANVQELEKQISQLKQEIGSLQSELSGLQSFLHRIVYELKLSPYLNEMQTDKYNEYKESVESLPGSVFQMVQMNHIIKRLLNDDINYMTNDQIMMYTYLYNNYNAPTAEKYLKIISDEINQVKGAELALEFLNKLEHASEEELSNSLANYFDVTVKGLSDGIHTFWSGIGNAIYSDGILSEKDYSKMIILQYLSENSSILDDTYSISSSIGNMITPMTASFVLKRLKVPGAEKIGSILMGISAYGNAQEQALVSGTGRVAAFLYGASEGIQESVLSYFIGQIPGISKATDASFLVKIMQEGGEEAIQSILSSINVAVFLNEELNINVEEVLKSGIYGIITAGILNGGTIVINGVNIDVNNLSMETIGILDVVFKSGITIDWSKILDPKYIEQLNSEINNKIAHASVLQNLMLKEQIDYLSEIDSNAIDLNNPGVLENVIKQISVNMSTQQLSNVLNNDAVNLKVKLCLLSSITDEARFVDVATNVLNYSNTIINEYLHGNNTIYSDSKYDAMSKLVDDICLDETGKLFTEYLGKSGITYKTFIKMKPYQRKLIVESALGKSSNSKINNKYEALLEADYSIKLSAGIQAIYIATLNEKNGVYIDGVTAEDILKFRIDAKQGKYVKSKEVIVKDMDGNVKDYTEYFPSCDYFISDQGLINYTMEILNLNDSDLQAFVNNSELNLSGASDLEILGEYLKANNRQVSGLIFQNAQEGEKNVITFGGNIGNMSQLYSYTDSKGNKFVDFLTPVYVDINEKPVDPVTLGGVPSYYLKKVDEKNTIKIKSEEITINESYNITGGAYMLLTSPEDLALKYGEFCEYNSKTKILTIKNMQEFGDKVLSGVPLDNINGTYMIQCTIPVNSQNISMPSVNNGGMYTAYGVPGGYLLSGEPEAVISAAAGGSDLVNSINSTGTGTVNSDGKEYIITLMKGEK